MLSPPPSLSLLPCLLRLVFASCARNLALHVPVGINNHPIQNLSHHPPWQTARPMNISDPPRRGASTEQGG